MKNTIKISVCAVAFFALASAATFAAGPSAPSAVSGAITLNANVLTDDAVDCSGTGSVNFGDSLVQGESSAAKAISCNVTDNDTVGVDMYVYATTALTGSTSANKIALTNISWSKTSGGTFVAFTDVSSATGVTSAMGGEVYAGLASGLNAAAENFYLKLAVPANQQADTYSTTVIVGIVPAVS